MGKRVTDMKGKLDSLLKQAGEISDAAIAEDRDFTSDERSKVTAILTEARDLKANIRQAEEDAGVRDTIAELGAGLVDAKGVIHGNQERGRSLGEAFVTDPAIKAWLGQVAPGGRIPDSVRGIVSPPVQFRDLGLFGKKELITGDSDISAGAFVQTDYTGIYEPLGRYPLTVRDMISVRTTTSDLVEFVRQTYQVTQAAAVPEANVTEYSGASGEVSGEKPEGRSRWEKVQEAVKTIAVWIPATKRALSDAAQLRGLIDQELREDLAEELEDQIINGDGVGENMTGILNTAGILTQAWDTDILTTTRKAKTTLRTLGRQRPTGWLINPADWETIELLQDDSGRFYWGGPLTNGQPQLWGVPVAESETIAEGTALLGNWRKAVLWDREAYSLQVSDSHEDFFIRNMVALLAEIRAAFGVIRPTAFVEVDLEAGS